MLKIMNNNNRWVYLHWTDEDREAMLKVYGRTPNTVKEDISYLKQWWSQQPHLPNMSNVINEDLIEFLLLLSKFRIERTKQNLDMYLSIRPYLSDVFNMNDFRSVMANCDVFVMKNLTKKYQRISIIKFKHKTVNICTPEEIFAYALQISEVRLRTDRCLSNIFITDCKHITFDYMLKVSPVLMRKIYIIYEKVYSLRFDGMYFINAPNYFDKLLTLIKSILPTKLIERVKSSVNDDIFLELFPKSEIPKEYGGYGESVEELSHTMYMKVKEFEVVNEAIRNNPVNENLRPGEPLDSDLFGTEGTFRQLHID